MSIPLLDPIELPPDWTLVDVQTLEDAERDRLQGDALGAWADEEGLDLGELVDRNWDPNEGIFAVLDGVGDLVGVSIVWDVEAL